MKQIIEKLLSFLKSRESEGKALMKLLEYSQSEEAGYPVLTTKQYWYTYQRFVYDFSPKSFHVWADSEEEANQKAMKQFRELQKKGDISTQCLFSSSESLAVMLAS